MGVTMDETQWGARASAAGLETGLTLEFPNKMARILLLSLEDVLGQTGLNAVLNLARLSQFIDAYPPANFAGGVAFAQVSDLLAAVDEMYGPRGGHMLTLRAGRACFKYSIQDFGGLVGLGDLVFRLLPINLRARLALEVVAEIFNRYSDQALNLYQEDDAYFLVIERCGVCWERTTAYPACALIEGLLQEGLYWISGGRLFDIEEVACRALGDATCTFRVEKWD
jgi:predicted hydrocarbon binding protein